MNENSQILIVDDEELACLTIQKIVMKKGYVSDMTLSGREAIQKLENNKYAIVLLDILMPDVDGFEVLKKLKEISPETEAIMVTALYDIQQAMRAIKEGACDYIVKEISRDWDELLIATINRAYQRYKMNLLVSDLLKAAEYIAKEIHKQELILQKITQGFRRLLSQFHYSVLILKGDETGLLHIQSCTDAKGNTIQAFVNREMILLQPEDFGIMNKKCEPVFTSGDVLQSDYIFRDICENKEIKEDITRVALPAIYGDDIKGVLVFYIPASVYECKQYFREINRPLEILGIILHLLHLQINEMEVQNLASNFHHNISPLLAPLTDYISENKTNEALDVVDRIRDVLRYMRRIIRTHGQLEFNIYNLSNIIEVALNSIPNIIGKTEIIIENNLKEGDLKIKADKSLLQNVFICIFENSVKAIEKRAKESPVKYNGEIIILGEIDNGNIKITITDNGIGVKRPDLLFQIIPEDEEDEEAEGSGTALYNAKIVIFRHKGNIYYDGVPENGGARFCIELPLFEYKNEEKDNSNT